ncbi:MAG: MSMEG_3727 family PQQ-associated protein, partial [Sulfurifustaceae bacterium]
MKLVWETLVMERPFALLSTLLVVVAVSGCTYAALLRPSVLKQLDPQVAELVNELPNVDAQNKEMIGRLFAHGGLSHASDDADGIMRDRIRVPSGEFIWKPAIVVMSRPGELELDIANEDDFSHHAALLPSNGDKQFVMLPVHARGKARVQLDGPGYYWFGCPVGNHAGRGMLGLIIVRGDVPPEARLDRPRQPRP